MERKVLCLVILVSLILVSCTETAASPTATASISEPAIAPTGTMPPTATVVPSAIPTDLPTATATATPLPTPDLAAYSPLIREYLGFCKLIKGPWAGEMRPMTVECSLPEGTALYAIVDGRVEINGEAPWWQLNLFYPDPEKGFLLYRLHGDWEMAIEHGAQVKQGDLLAVGLKPISDEQSASLVLARGKSSPIGYENIELPEELVNLWPK